MPSHTPYLRLCTRAQGYCTIPEEVLRLRGSVVEPPLLCLTGDSRLGHEGIGVARIRSGASLSLSISKCGRHGSHGESKLEKAHVVSAEYVVYQP